MSEIFDRINNSDLFTSNTKYYWGYQYRLGSENIVPYLLKNHAFKKGDSVAEIGSAEGGVLSAFVEAGCNNALGTDIIQKRLDLGKEICTVAGVNIEFLQHNIVTEEIPLQYKQKFDLLILRDVIEHLDFTQKALENMKLFLKKGGFLFVTFPPYYSPFGGHQHTLVNFWGRFPYIHWLPDLIFNALIASGRKNDIGEVKRLRNIRLTPKKFTAAAKAAGFDIVHEDFYLLREVYKYKFGLPAIKVSKISFIPFVKNFFSLEASYILQVK